MSVVVCINRPFSGDYHLMKDDHSVHKQIYKLLLFFSLLAC